MRQPIPFGNNFPSVDIPGHLSAMQTGSCMRDVYVDGRGNYIFRPVLDLGFNSEEESTVKGLYWWDEKQIWLAVIGVNLWYSTDETLSTLTKLTSAVSFSVGSNKLVSWANFGTVLYAANGNKIKKITTSPVAMIEMADADAPTSVSCIVAKDKYLIALEDGTGKFHWSDVGDPDAWSGNYAEAEQEPDEIYKICSDRNYLYLFGKKTGEVWYNDGVTPWSRLTQGSFSGGARSKWVATWCDYIGTFVWITDDYRCVKLIGRDTVSLSPTLDQYLSHYKKWADPTEALSDTFGRNFAGHYVYWDGIPFYVLVHHTTVSDTYDYCGLCVAVNLLTGDWYEWTDRWYSEAYEVYRILPFQASCFAMSPNGYTCAGDAYYGMVHTLVRGDSDDCYRGDIFPKLRSTFVDRGDSGVDKICKSLTLKFKAPYAHTGTSFSLSIGYSDNGGKTWSSNRVVSCASLTAGTMEKTIVAYNFGVYKERQWQININYNGDVIGLGPVIEDFDYVY